MNVDMKLFRGIFLTILMLVAFGTCSVAQAETGGFLSWKRLPDLPPGAGQDVQPGLAGAFVGVHNGVMIVAGGTNFPEALPWDGGKKVWHDDVFVLEKTPEDSCRWIVDAGWKLKRPLAYGVAVSTPDGVVCIGGNHKDGCYADVFFLRWDASAREVMSDSFPPLPRCLANMSAVLAGNTIYLAGGQEETAEPYATHNFWALDLSHRGTDLFVWQELGSWPGPPRILPIMAVQSDGVEQCLYLFSGRNIAPDMPSLPLCDAYKFSPGSDTWRRIADITPGGEPSRSVMAGTGIESGAYHVLIFGGAYGILFQELERIDSAIAIAETTDEADSLRTVQREILGKHPGFSKDILAYNTITDTWVRVGVLPVTSHVTTAAVRWDGGIVIPSGEIRPGMRTLHIWRAENLPTDGFGTLNYSVLIVYFLLLVTMGLYFSRRERSTDDFFKAGGRIPWWAAGLSIFGTQLSALTFMAIPAKTYATDWRYFMYNMSIVMVAPLIVMLFLPFFRRLNITSAYEYLELRFNTTARLIGSLMFIILQLGRIGIVLLLPSIALSVVTGMSVYVCILAMGILSITYTVLGGIEAVIWTDVVQVFVILGGVIISLAVIITSLDGDIAGIIGSATAHGKLHTFDFSLDFTVPTLWVVIFGGIAANIISYGSDQTVIQRYLTTCDEKSAARSVWTNAVLTIPASLLFFGMGTALYLYYRAYPEYINPTLANPDAIFPWYIVNTLPAGVSGLLISALFAAAMSSLDSSMNSVATAVTTDFYRQFREVSDDRQDLAFARWVTAIVGIAGTAFASVMVGWNIQSLFDQFVTFLGLFAGGLGGMFLLGMLTCRASGAGAVTGLIVSGIVQYFVGRYTPIHTIFYTLTGLATCFTVGYVMSLLLPSNHKSIDGLTIYTRRIT